MDAIIRWAKALADPTRLRILQLLRHGELCVCEVSDALVLSQSTLSSHLQVLRQTGLVSTRKDAKWIYYALVPDQVALVEAVWTHFHDPADLPAALYADRTRLHQRLALREDGKCVIGSGSHAPTTT